MSTQNKLSKLITRFEIVFDNETKAEIDSLKGKLDEVSRALSVKNYSHGDRLLAAMQAEAANNAPVTYSPWENDLNRATVNDVDYLSGSGLDECAPDIDDVLNQPNWLSESVPQITQADMRLIFIKNLSECLIQRMHSMERFSTHDYEIGQSGGGMTAWDIVFDKGARRFGLVTALQKECIQVVVFFPCLNRIAVSQSQGLRQDMRGGKRFRTITENELGAFRAALEVCYA